MGRLLFLQLVAHQSSCSRLLQVEVNRRSRVQCVVEQAASSIYMDSRSVTLRATLRPGPYVVVPTTFLPGATGRFLLRLFSHSPVKLRCVEKADERLDERRLINSRKRMKTDFICVDRSDILILIVTRVYEPALFFLFLLYYSLTGV